MKKILNYLLVFISFVVVMYFSMIVFLYPKTHSSIVSTYASNYNIDKNLVYAIIYAESKFDEFAVSRTNARGLMQLSEQTFLWIASQVNEVQDFDRAFDVETNIKYGCYYLSYLKDKYDNNSFIICAYNAGETVVSSWMSDRKFDKNKIEYKETEMYYERVMYAKKIYELKR
ncbi:MAG: lytic transglycosylase domain-containing protein [Clostridia bacterium]